MIRRAFDMIAFDGDDTLWHNERTYRDGRERFRRVLAGAGVALTADQIDAAVNRVEVANLRYFGYGVSSFALSLMETAIALTDGAIAGRDLHRLVELAKDMMSEPIEVFGLVTETLAALSSTHPLMLVTKGDLLHQTSKLERSGLQKFFAHVEVVSHKTPDVYGRILTRHGVTPSRFLMVGNSLRSDVLPVLELGATAVHVPAELTWAHEDADPPGQPTDRYFAVSALDEVLAIVERLEASAVSRA